MITLGIPVLNNYEGLYNLIVSAESGSVIPDKYFIVNNGVTTHYFKNGPMAFLHSKLIIAQPTENLGVAISWNLIIKSTQETRIICNDDIEFEHDTIEKLVKLNEDFVSPQSLDINSFSCFKISDKLIKSVGLFDETISPKYAYFEDNDYALRMYYKGFKPAYADCSVRHSGSTTLKNYSPKELSEHHKKFDFAKIRYIEKWGGAPGEERYSTPYNKESYD